MSGETRKDLRRHERLRGESERDASRAEAMRLFDDLTKKGPGNEGLLSLCLLSMRSRGFLDTKTFQDLYLRAIQRMGFEAATDVFLGGEDVDEDVRKAIEAIRRGSDSRFYDSLDITQAMAERIGLDPEELDVRLGEEEARLARSSDAVAVEQGGVIYLDERRVDPRTHKGREVIGHEVAHVAQVEKGRVPATTRAAEVEASQVAQGLAEGRAVGAPTVALGPNVKAAYSPSSSTDPDRIGPESLNSLPSSDKENSAGFRYKVVQINGRELTVQIRGTVTPENVRDRKGKARQDATQRTEERTGRTGKAYREGDDAGHLVAWVLGGDSSSANLAPQVWRLNRGGAWRNLEDVFKMAAEENLSVKIMIQIWWKRYDDGYRPETVTVDYEFEAQERTTDTKEGETALTKAGLRRRGHFRGHVTVPWDSGGFAPDAE